MDPVSIIASIAGIATAGVQISNTLFRLVKTYRNAPTEIRAMAIEMAGLTVTLEHLRDILNTGHSYTRPLFFEGVRHVIKNIQSTQQEIHKMIDDRTILARFKWLKSKRLLSDIDKHKVTLTLQITILSAAVLVKSTNRSLPISEKCDNRFRIQAESLIQAGQASLQNDNTARPEIPDPPQERAPSPPVRTTKRFPSPVRQSEIPGHIRTEDLDGQPSAARDRLHVPEGAGDDARSLVSRRRRTSQSLDHDADIDIRFEREGMLDQGPGSEESRRGRSAGFDPLSGKLAQFGRDFHVRGDAATFLYKLVFQDEETPCAPTIDHQGETNDGNTYGRYRDELGIERSYQNRSRSSTKYVTHEPQEPSRVVNQLLLTWTSLSQDEIEKGTAEPKPDTKENPPKHTAYVESESEDEEVQSNLSRSRSIMARGSDDEEGFYFDPASRRQPRERQYRSRQRRSTPPIQPAEDRTYHPPPSLLPEVGSYYSCSEYSSHPIEYPYPPPYPEPAQYPTPLPDSRQRKQFQKPHVVVLPHADPADSEIGSTIPKLDISDCLNMSIARQDENSISNCDDFTAQRRIPGKAIMGALVGDRSARDLHGLDLANTLIEGQSVKLVYIRGNDLGETWFINEQPVFLQFLHCGYLPQFYPAKDSNDVAMKQEYLAIGEEWASFEALNMLGLSVKKREEGRVLLDPNTTWSMIQELAIMTLQMRCMRQRRSFAPTFYNSISTFRLKHGGVTPPPRISIPVPETLSSVSLGPPSIAGGERDIDVMNFLVKEEKPKVEVVTDTTQNDLPSRTLQPQISITPPPTPKETNTEFDISEVASTVSSTSRFSKFIKRYKSGRKQDRLSLPPGHGSKSSTTIVESEDGKRPLTPTDSGIGSSVC
ncbi:hypothetical protein FGRMN_1193 [Fusarium graminum]|nr:hypothetical protein FGRMN_1193 [Fusarium graminum]